MSYSIGGFASGLAGGLQTGQAIKDRKADRILERENLELRREELAARKQGYGVMGTPFFEGSAGSRGGGSTAAYDVSGDPVAEGLEPEQKAFLNMIAGGESGGKYNVRYTPQGGAPFEGYGRHPGIMEPGPHGQSSAAGRYQFTQSTWNDLGGGDFSPARQDQQALALARRDYRARTGRDFDRDLKNGVSDQMIDALAPTWAALKSNRGRHASTYRASLDRYRGSGAGPTTPETEAAPAPAGDEKLSWGAIRRSMSI